MNSNWLKKKCSDNLQASKAQVKVYYTYIYMYVYTVSITIFDMYNYFRFLESVLFLF